jgi:predicted RNA-binding Zn-ribbon protein involved in translation (DUF1610 family)/DNA polymerase elongation subunit (family B)
LNILIYDLETRPSAGFIWRAWDQNISAGQVIEQGHVICWAAKWLNDPRSKTMFGCEWEGDDPDEYIHRLHALMEEADAVLTFNGNKFDEPVLRTEFVLRGLAPTAPHKSIDLYQVVRRQFRFLHNRMDSVAEYFGVPGKTNTGGFQLWVDVMNREPKALAKMKKYNIQDIRVLEDIYYKLLPWIPNHPALGHHDESGELHSCPTCGSHKLQKRGKHKTKASTFQRYQCNKCGTWSRSRIADKSAPKPEIVSL